LHNTVDCYNKPGNGDKHPYKNPSQKLSPPGPNKYKNLLFKAWLMKMFEKSDDGPDIPPENVKINNTTIKEIPDPVLSRNTQVGFSLGTVEYNICDLQSEKGHVLTISSQMSEVVLESCSNIAHNKTTFFKISVTLWVYGKKVQTKALVDSGATTNFVDRVVMENNNLVTHKLANPYCVINTDSTPNKAGQITEYV